MSGKSRHESARAAPVGWQAPCQNRYFRAIIQASRPNGRVHTAHFFWAFVFSAIVLKTTQTRTSFHIAKNSPFTTDPSLTEPAATAATSPKATIEQTVTGLGYELVDVERTAGGLLRVTIDMPYTPGAGQVQLSINAEDCEKVTRQLVFVLEVEGANYSRLEVSSPGIDRPLRSQQDLERFTGELIDLTLKAPIGAAATAGSSISALQKKFRGTLEANGRQSAEAGGAALWQIVWSDEPEVKPGVKVSKKRVAAPLQALGFTLDEIAQARLAPVVDFKGRKPKSAPDVPAPNAQPAS